MAQEKPLMTAKEAAEYLGVTENTLAVWRTTKRYNIPYIKVGHLIRYRSSVLDKWLDERTKGEKHE